MTDFKAKMHQIRFRLELRPRHPLGELTALHRSPSWIWGPLRGRREGLGWGRGGKGEGKGREGELEGRKGRAPLLLNQGPSEPCYATGQTRHCICTKASCGLSATDEYLVFCADRT